MSWVVSKRTRCRLLAGEVLVLVPGLDGLEVSVLVLISIPVLIGLALAGIFVAAVLVLVAVASCRARE